MWASVATGGISLWVGALIDRFGLGFVFAYTYAARAVLVACIAYALAIAARETRDPDPATAPGRPPPAAAADRLTAAQYVRRVLAMVHSPAAAAAPFSGA